MRPLFCALMLFLGLIAVPSSASADGHYDADWLRAQIEREFSGCRESDVGVECVHIVTASTAPIHFIAHCGGSVPHSFFGIAWMTVSRLEPPARPEARRRSVSFSVLCVRTDGKGALIVEERMTGPWPESLPP